MRHLLRYWPALAILLVGACLTLLVTVAARHLIRTEVEAEFKEEALRLSQEVRRRIELTAYGLKGARGAIAAAGPLSRDGLRQYVASRNLPREFPGVRGFGYIEKVARERLADFVHQVRREGEAAFEVKTEGNASDLYVIKYIEPLAANLPALGYDIGSELHRRAAADKAAATGEPTLTARLTLLQDHARSPGWLLLVPVFMEGNRLAVDGPPPPQAVLVGWLYAPLVASEILAPLADAHRQSLRFRLADVELAADELFDSERAAPGGFARVAAQAEFRDEQLLTIGGRRFRLEIASSPLLERSVSMAAPAGVMAAGIVISLALALAAWALLSARKRALDMATRMTAALADSEALMRLVADHMPGRLAYWDAELRCRFANRAYIEHFDLRPDNVVGRHASHILGPAYFAANRGPLDRALAGETVTFERLDTDASGVRSTSLVHCVPDRRDGVVHGVVVMALDISELRASRDAAASAAAAKGEFLATMSHEIRTPLNGVIGLTQVLARRGLGGEEGEMVRLVDSSARSLLAIVDDVLDFSKIEAGHMRIEHVAFDLRALVEELAAVSRLRATQAGIEFELRIDPAVPGHVTGDPTRLRQVIGNLLSNAVKFTRHGRVLLEVAPVRASGRLAFSVHDTGVGISEEACSRLFTRFEQAGASTSREFGGTGLGLAIVQRLCGLMGGSILVRSQLGKGSVFSFELPLPSVQNQAAAAPVRGPHEEVAFAAMRVLLVDDNATNQIVGRHLLSLAGVRDVDIASDGSEAVRLALGGTYDLILMDCRMPVMDGFEATAQLRAAGCRARIVALTANAMEIDRQRCLDAGMDGHLAKPITIEALIAALQGAGGPEALKSVRGKSFDRDDFVRRFAGAPDIGRAAIGAFLANTPGLLDRLARAVAAGDHAAVQLEAHSARGSGALVSAACFATTAEEIEGRAAQLGPDELAALNRKLQQEFQEYAAAAQSGGSR